MTLLPVRVVWALYLEAYPSSSCHSIFSLPFSDLEIWTWSTGLAYNETQRTDSYNLNADGHGRPSAAITTYSKYPMVGGRFNNGDYSRDVAVSIRIDIDST